MEQHPERCRVHFCLEKEKITQKIRAPNLAALLQTRLWVYREPGIHRCIWLCSLQTQDLACSHFFKLVDVLLAQVEEKPDESALSGSGF